MSEAPGAAGTLQWWGMTDKGLHRKNNEDAFLLMRADGRNVALLGKEGSALRAEGEYLFAVSDGMGGANAGEFASRIAVQKLTEVIARRGAEGTVMDTAARERSLVEVFGHIHHAMLEMGQHYAECRGMGATLSLGWYTADTFTLCHVGDSRIYYLTAEGELTQLTEDHTHVGWLRRQGQINEREARSHHDRSKLEQALGGRQKQLLPQVCSLPTQTAGLWLYCTDGLMEGLWERNLGHYLQTPPPHMRAFNPAERLIREAMDGGSRDNLTAVVVRANP